jgi:hypothetical protein
MKFREYQKWLFVLLAVIPLSLAKGQNVEMPEAPGPLSLSHAGSPGLKNCFLCHTQEFESAPEKCLSCHTEIAQRIAEGRGFHKDKKQNCGTCHAEHQGQDKSLVPQDIKSFDHKETGFALLGVHARVGNCDLCHQQPNSYPREKTKSYLLRDTQCTTCHSSPHPGHQENCLSCHTFENWWVEGWKK